MKRSNFERVFDALTCACLHLELNGWCPKAPNRDRNRYFRTCETYCKYGSLGCNICLIREMTDTGDRLIGKDAEAKSKSCKKKVTPASRPTLPKGR